MDKIDRSKYNMYMMGNSPVVKNMDKIDELIEGYNEIMKRLERMDKEQLKIINYIETHSLYHDDNK